MKLKKLEAKLKVLEGGLVKLQQTKVDSFVDIVFEDNDGGSMVFLTITEIEYSLFMLFSNNARIFVQTCQHIRFLG